MAQATAINRFYAYISSAWVLLDDIHPVNTGWGMLGNSPVDRVARTGDFSIPLNNSTGQYSPNGPSALSGWKKGIPFKWVVTYDGEDYIKFRGIISDIQIRPNNKDKKAYVTVLDWMDYAARHPIINPGVLTDQTGDDVITTVLSELSVQPQAVSLDAGVETFPTTFDTVTSKTKAYSEFAKVSMSEIGYTYLVKDRTYGETLRFEGADSRHGWNAVGNTPLSNADAGFLLKESDGSFLLKESDGDKLILNQTEVAPNLDGTYITDFDAPYGEHVVNRLTVSAFPRKLDSSPQVLFTLSAEIVIGSGQTVTIKGTYSNPSGGLPINAQDMITPVITTDYTAFTATSGGGSNVSADLVIVDSYGTEGFTHQVTNNNASPAFVNKFNCRGTGIYIDNPIEHAATDSGSISELDTESETFNQKYKNDLQSGTVWADSIVDEFRQPRTVLNSISFCANKSSQAMMMFLYTDIGSLRYIDISEAGVSGKYYIQGIEVNMRGGLIFVKWIVVLSLSLATGCGLAPVAVEFAGGAATDGINFGVLPRLNNLNEKSFSVWLYEDAAPVSVGDGIIAPFSDNDGVYIGISVNSQVVFLSKEFNTTQGIWLSPNSSAPLGQWVHIVITHNSSSASNDPIMYIDTSSQTLTEFVTPTGTRKTETGAGLVIGNWKTSTEDYTRSFDGKIFDPRIYDTILTPAQITELYNSGTPDESILTDPSTGLIFQGLAVRTGDTANYIGQTLTSSLTLRDAVYGTVGVPHGAPVGRAAP